MSTFVKTFLILLILAVFGAIGYFVFVDDGSLGGATSPLQTSTGQPVSGLSQQNQVVDADEIGQQFLSQLLNIRSLKLREDIFSRPAFLSLEDFTINLVQPGNEGRRNPFAPFGIDTSSVSVGSSQTPTLPQGETVIFGEGSVLEINGSDVYEDLENS